jgi:hypothetical protein
MFLEEAKDYLNKFNFYIRFDSVLKLYQIYSGYSIIYVSEKDFQEMSPLQFKCSLAEAVLVESQSNRRIRLH